MTSSLWQLVSCKDDDEEVLTFCERLCVWWICSSLPELLETKRLVDMHTNVATAILDQIKVKLTHCHCDSLSADVVTVIMLLYCFWLFCILMSILAPWSTQQLQALLISHVAVPLFMRLCKTQTIISGSQESPFQPNWICTIFAFYLSSCMALSAGQSPREMYSRSTLSTDGVCESC